MNTANTVSITYNNGNGQINGALRILITLTLIALAPTIIIMMTSFTQDHHRAALYQIGTEYADGTAESDPDRAGTDPDIFSLWSLPLRESMKKRYSLLRREHIDQSEALEKGMAPLREFMVSADTGEGCRTVHGYRRTGVGWNPGGYSQFRVGSQLYDQ